MHQSTLVLQGDSVPVSTNFPQHKIPMREKEFKQNTLTSAAYCVIRTQIHLPLIILVTC